MNSVYIGLADIGLAAFAYIAVAVMILRLLANPPDDEE